MFTGIIECMGLLESIEVSGSNTSFLISSSIAQELKVDQSLAHNGVCLTIEEISGSVHKVTAIAETLSKTNLGHWKTGDKINLERCLSWNGRLDGHIVQGHVDTVGTCIEANTLEGSWEYRIAFPSEFAELVIEKGSISLNGISLTVFDVTHKSFKVAIIPYTFEHTNMSHLKVGDRVNLEFDILGKYVSRMLQIRNTK